jgi:hypothetical protein
MIDCALVMSMSELNAPCQACGDAALWGKGPRIVDAVTAEPICRACGRTHAPHLIALLDLAQTANKVGRHSRHLLTPPMNSLLELARAAETFAVTSLPPRARAG